MSGAGKTSVSSRVTENNSDHGSFVGIFITLGGLLLIAFGVVVHRDVKVKKMRSELSNGDNRSRTVAVYRYMLKYLKLIGIADSRNITDLKLWQDDLVLYDFKIRKCSFEFLIRYY